MKKILIILFFSFLSNTSLSAELKRITSGNEDAKITIIAYESLTCSHCADFHKKIYPKIKKDFIDAGLVKIEFRHFPLDIAALNAAKIAQCAFSKNLEVLESLYFNQNVWVKGKTVDELNENLKNFVSSDFFFLTNCSGVPTNTTSPPLSPP